MGFAIYERNGRDCGYGVPSLCDQPDCDSEIDRGLAYICGGDLGSDHGCNLYFCGRHMYFYNLERDGVSAPQMCDVCGINFRLGSDNYKMFAETYTAKPDMLKWVLWKLHAGSWTNWREEHKELVILMEKQVGFSPKPYVHGLMDELKEELEFDRE